MSAACEDCELTAADLLAEGFDPKSYFERGDDGAMRCQGCLAIQSANRRFAEGDW